MSTEERTRRVVPSGLAGERLDRFLTNLGEFGTRSQVQRLIAADRVAVNGKPAKAGAALRPGDRVDVAPLSEDGPASLAEAEDIPLSVIYEDEDLLVIDKPVGLVVHPGPGHRSGTLVSALLHRWQGAPPGLDERRPGIVHRLDRETSGVLVVGKTAEVVMRLSAQFRAREVAKEYLAVVWRCPRPRAGVLEGSIGRHATQRQRMAIRDGGRVALTRYEVTEDFVDLAVLRVRPETGRTHQIRVHLAAAGHPILGDRVYGRARAVSDLLLRDFPRHALHASRLELDHPRSAERLVFEAPLPQDLRALLAHLRARSKASSSGGIA